MNKYDNILISNICPIIDSVIDRMEHARNDAHRCLGTPNKGHDLELDRIVTELNNAIFEMERIKMIVLH